MVKKHEPDQQPSVAIALIGVLRALAERDPIKWLSLAFIAWVIGDRAIGHLAGRMTFADIGISFLGGLTIERGALYIAVSVAVLIAAQREKLRRDTIERLGNEKVELEKKVDPGRSSSKLTAPGSTRPGDKL